MRTYLLLPFILLLTASSCAGQAPGAKSVNDSRRHVRRHTERPPSGSEIELSSFNFLRPYVGHEGPNFSGLEGEPSAGVEYLAEAELSGLEAAATAKFEMVDERGRVIQPLRFSKSSNSLDEGDFLGLVRVPPQPFRVKVSGTDVGGAAYESVYGRLFRPTKRPPKPPLLPPGLPPAQAESIGEGLKELERQAKARLESELGQHADGLIRLPHARVSNVTYEPYISDKGNPLGIRLRYDIEYPADGDYAHSLQVFPYYKDVRLRGLVEMQVVNERRDPRPDPPSYATPKTHVDLEALVKYGSAARYRGGIVYHFVIDLVPDFVGQNATRTKFCVDEAHHVQKVKTRREWEEMKSSGAPVAYRIFMPQADYGGDTEPLPPPGTFYEGFLREGAVPCQPYKNKNF